MTTAQQLFDQAVAKHRAGQREEAITLYRQVLRQCPTHTDTLHLIGMLYTQSGKLSQAVASIEQAIGQNPNIPQFYNSLGNALRAQERWDEAAAAYQKAIALNANYAEAHGNLAIVQKRLNLLDDAIYHYEVVLSLDPKIISAHYNLGNAYGEKALIEKSIAAYRQAIALKPDYADAQMNLAHALLLDGQWTEGWERYEWRFAQRVPVRNYGKPFWEGEPLAGRTLLVQWEQGYGDTFQFIRFLSQLSDLEGQVIFECQPGLIALLRNSPIVSQCVEGSSDGSAPQVPFDLCIPLMSLPRLLNTEPATLMTPIPYILPDPGLVERWKQSISPSAGLKVGIVWASNPHVDDRLGRSCALSDFERLASLPDIHWYSLQKGVSLPSQQSFVTHLGPKLQDFSDTAAAIANLDLVISVDTSVAHLAAAMGKTTWTLLPYVPNWRWLLDQPNTPWYPNMRLFRQKTPGNWSEVFLEIAHALEQFRP